MYGDDWILSIHLLFLVSSEFGLVRISRLGDSDARFNISAES